MYIGTTGVAINRGSAALTLAGITLTTPDIGAATASGVTLTSTNTTQTTTSAALSVVGNSLTTGTGIYTASSSLSSGALIDLAVTGTAAATGQKGINISLSGTNGSSAQTTYGAYISNTHAGSGTNVGLYATASGGGTQKNYAGIFDAGQILMGLTSVSTDAKLSLSNTISSNGSTSAIAGIHGDYTFNNGGNASYVQVGNRFVFNNAPTTNPNTMAGEIIRTVDNTALANTVRGIDITSNAGSNTAGTNTGLRATGATFGVQGITSGLAGGVSVPAALYGENDGTTLGDILRLYSTSVTSAPSFASFFHSTTAFSGTGLLMNFASGSGSYSGNYIDLKNNNTTVFKVDSNGVPSVGLGSTASTNAVCSSLANTTSPTAKVAYELRDCSSSPAADYAEMYPVEKGITYGDIVMTGTKSVMTYDTTDGNIDWNKEKGSVSKLIKSNGEYQSNVIGIISDNYGDFSSTGNNIKKEDNPMPVALSGRVPVKISNNSESIKYGDYLTTSDDEGMAMKATGPGFAIGKALSEWNPGDGKNTVMVFIDQGYYNGSSIDNKQTTNGLTFSTVDGVQNIIFEAQTEFVLPPIWNSDTAGFAIIKKGSKKVDVTFDNSYAVEPVVTASISFEKGDNMTDDTTQQFLDEGIASIVTSKSQNGFTIAINKTATKDIRFSWIAFAVKDAKIFESIVPGLVIDNSNPISTPTSALTPSVDTSSSPSPSSISNTTPTSTPDTTSTPADTGSSGEAMQEIIPVTDQTPTTDTTPSPTTTSTPESASTQTSPNTTSTPDSTPSPSQTQTQ